MITCPSPAFTSSASPVETVLSLLQKVKRTKPNQWAACCPAHDDKQASLGISIGNDGRVLLTCRAGCSTETVLHAMNLQFADLYASQEKRPSQFGRLVASYNYTDADGKLLYQVCRYDPKGFSQRRPDGSGRWINNLNGVARVLYGLPAVLDAVNRGEPIFLPEGEKDCENLQALGLNATTNAQGADQPFLPAYAEALRDADAIILPDDDNAGRVCRDRRIKGLLKTAKRIRVLDLPHLPGMPSKGADVSDWLAAGGTKEELLRLAANAPDVSPLDAEMQNVINGLNETFKGLPVTVEANGLITLAENAKISDVTSAIYRADKFGKRSNVVVNLCIGALAALAGNTRGAQKNFAETMFGKDENMRDHAARCKQAYIAWNGIYDVNRHDWNWSTLLLGSRQIFSQADRREMVARSKTPTGPELEEEIDRRKMAQSKDGTLTQKPAAQFQRLMKVYRQTKTEAEVNALYRQFSDLIMAEMGIGDDPEEDVSEAEYGDCIKETTSLTYSSVHSPQPKLAPELPSIYGDSPSDSAADLPDGEEEYAAGRAMVESAYAPQQAEEVEQSEREDEEQRWQALGVETVETPEPIPVLSCPMQQEREDALQPFSALLDALESGILPHCRVTLPDGCDVMSLHTYVKEQVRRYHHRENPHKSLQELALCQQAYAQIIAE